MKSPALPPKYPNSPIKSMASLSRMLGVSVDALQKLASSSNDLYRAGAAKQKADGTIRETFDALGLLKDVHRRIKLRIFDQVIFPHYLTGSLKGMDARRNAAQHAGAALTVCEDIRKFFPSIKSSHVFDIWHGFFGFSAEVSSILTDLTTKDGFLPQGVITSSHLANLVFWRREHDLFVRFSEVGIHYSRYVDDVSISSTKPVLKDTLTKCIADLYGMLFALGFRPHRGKQQIQRANRDMRVTKLLVNRRAALPVKDRHAIRACVHQIQCLIDANDVSGARRALASASGRIARMATMHQSEASLLRRKIENMKASIRNRSSDD